MLANNEFNIFYLILHYKNYEHTINCIKSIISKVENPNILVIDNGSNDNSLKTIINQFSFQFMHIHNSTNLGFSRGFNSGIDYIEDKFQNNFYVLLNSDTELLSDSWNKIILNKYRQYNFDVLGPDILNLDYKTHVNPRKTGDYRLTSVSFKILVKIIEVILLALGLDVIALVERRRSNAVTAYIDEDKENVELQGSCLILSPKYVYKYRGLYNKTFLYYEESILKYILDRDKGTMIYTPDLRLLHKEYGSTEGSEKINRKKRVFQLKHALKSRIVLLKLIFKDHLSHFE